MIRTQYAHKVRPPYAHRISLLVLVVGFACAFIALGAIEASAQNPEYRAFWIDAWGAGFKSQSEIDALLGVPGNASSKGTIRNANCNTVFVQMRRRADVCYPSSMGEPYFSGLSPASFNALQAIINAAHDTTGGKQRIEVHAWIVAFATSTDGGTPSPVYYQHNNPADLDNYWVTLDSSGNETADKAFDPGHPKCEEYLANVAMDLVTNFDIDGIHYDYIRFTGTTQGYNPVSVSRYNARYGLTGQPASTNSQWQQWRRDQVSALVRKVYAKIQAVKPSVRQSGSFVTWNPSPTASTRSAFQATSPYQVYSDWDSWIQEGIVDMAVPMTYYNNASLPNDYTKWINFEKDRKGNRHMIIGPGIYLNSLQNALNQILATRTPSPAGNYAQGFSGYSYRVPYNGGTWAGFSPSLVSQVTPTPVNTPTMTWKTAPTKGHISGTVTLSPSGTWADSALITLTGPQSRTQYCDGTGFYAFIDLTPGTYTVSASKSGFTTVQRTVTVAVGQVTGNMYVTDIALGGTPPLISNVRAENIGPASADIKWTTNVAADSQVEYGLTTSYGSSSAMDFDLTLSHTLTLAGLQAGRTYHYRVHSANSSGAEAISGDYTFTTVSDPTAPIISNVQVMDLGPSSARITWTTDDPSSSQVQYGLTASYGTNTTEDTTPVTEHSVSVSGLPAATTYHFRVKSTNGTPLTSYSGDGTFTTTAQVADIIVDNLSGEQSPAGSWMSGTYAGGWPTTASQYNFANVTASETATFTWRPNILTPGKYDVYVWYNTGTNRSTAAPYTVAGSSGSITVNVNQQVSGAQWFKIASQVSFAAGTTGYVKLGNGTTGSVVIADATRFVFVGAETTPPTIPQNVQGTAASATSIGLTWNPSTDDSGVAGYKVFRNSVYVGSTPVTNYTDAGLTANTQYAYTVSAYDTSSNESSVSSSSNCYTLALAPSASTIACARTAGTWYHTAPFAFTNTGFGAGKASYYRYAWDHAATHSWTNSETVWATTSASLNATSTTQPWYFHLRSYNSGNVGNGSFDMGPFYCDLDAPTVSGVTAPKYLAVRGSSYDDLTATWSGTDAVSGVAEYQYAIGSIPGETDILDWTSAGSATTATYHFANALSSNLDYYWTIKAKDQAESWSSPVSSAGTVYANAYNTLAEAMDNADDTPVIVDQAKTLSANFATYFYVQEANRTRGLRVNVACSWLPGDLVRVAGTLGTSLGERYLGEVEASYVSGGVAPTPLAVGVSAIGGLAPDSFTTGLGSAGVYNLGLLVRVAGKVSSKGSGYFVLGDGSGATVKVYSSFVPANNAIVAATGVAGVESGVRVIRTRSAADVRAF